VHNAGFQSLTAENVRAPALVGQRPRANVNS